MFQIPDSRGTQGVAWLLFTELHVRVLHTSRLHECANSDRPSFARKGETLRWTAYYNESLVVLEGAKEFPSDLLLVRLVQSRLIIEKVNEVSWGSPIEGEYLTRPSAMAYLGSLQAQLRALKVMIPVELADNSKSPLAVLLTLPRSYNRQPRYQLYLYIY